MSLFTLTDFSRLWVTFSCLFRHLVIFYHSTVDDDDVEILNSVNFLRAVLSFA